MLMSIAQSAYPALNTAQALYGPWLYTLLTGADSQSSTGVAATATGYTSQALLDARPQVRPDAVRNHLRHLSREQIHVSTRFAQRSVAAPIRRPDRPAGQAN